MARFTSPPLLIEAEAWVPRLLPVALDVWLEGAELEAAEESELDVGDAVWDDADGLGLALGSIDDDVSLLPGCVLEAPALELLLDESGVRVLVVLV